jgi:hypothetical protein
MIGNMIRGRKPRNTSWRLMYNNSSHVGLMAELARNLQMRKR